MNALVFTGSSLFTGIIIKPSWKRRTHHQLFEPGGGNSSREGLRTPKLFSRADSIPFFFFFYDFWVTNKIPVAYPSLPVLLQPIPPHHWPSLTLETQLHRIASPVARKNTAASTFVGFMGLEFSGEATEHLLMTVHVGYPWWWWV